MRWRMASLNARECAYPSGLLVCRTGCDAKKSLVRLDRALNLPRLYGQIPDAVDAVGADLRLFPQHACRIKGRGQ
jgi:hypothetical protein